MSAAEYFLEAMFADALPGAHTIVCGFVGDPYTAGRSGWAGRPWMPGQRLPSYFEHSNAYLTVSSFEPDPESGERRRRKDSFLSLHAVMIDDLGTKVPAGKLLLEPSALIETSPANFQAFLFITQDQSARDRALCERLIERMIAAGLTADGSDPGMKGVTRYGRLPCGVNAKRKYVEQLGHPFAVRCVSFNPERHFSIQQIAEAWRLDLSAPRAHAPVVPISRASAGINEGKFDALLRTLQLMDMYKGRIGSGPWHDITCPWVHHHTDSADGGTAIADPSEANGFAGGFACHHAHCTSRTIGDVWRWVRALSGELERRACQ